MARYMIPLMCTSRIESCQDTFLISERVSLSDNTSEMAFMVTSVIRSLAIQAPNETQILAHSPQVAPVGKT